MTEKKKVKRKVKYIIIASVGGIIYGAFRPIETIRAKKYLNQLKRNEPMTKINLYYVSNLNKFYAKRKSRIVV